MQRSLVGEETATEGASCDSCNPNIMEMIMQKKRSKKKKKVQYNNEQLIAICSTQ